MVKQLCGIILHIVQNSTFEIVINGQQQQQLDGMNNIFRFQIKNLQQNGLTLRFNTIISVSFDYIRKLLENSFDFQFPTFFLKLCGWKLLLNPSMATHSIFLLFFFLFLRFFEQRRLV